MKNLTRLLVLSGSSLMTGIAGGYLLYRSGDSISNNVPFSQNYSGNIEMAVGLGIGGLAFIGLSIFTCYLAHGRYKKMQAENHEGERK